MKRIRPPFKYYGGKFYLSKWIASLLPKHKKYVEPFGGAASVLLNKPISEIEIYNDLNLSITHLMVHIRDHLDDLVEILRNIKCDEQVFYEWKNRICEEPIDQAVKIFVLYRMSRGGSGITFSKSSRSYRGVSENVSSWNSSIDNLTLISERLQSVQIYSKNAIDLLKENDDSKTIFYLDPPYVSSSRRSFSKENQRFELGSVYQIEMDDKQHQELLEQCLKSNSMIVISGYESEMYKDMLSSWNSTSKETYLHSSASKKKSKAKEMVWANFTLLEHACSSSKKQSH